jgi:predicted NBD/HSP70 family sugar kinase
MVVDSSPLGWFSFALAQRLAGLYRVPVYTGSSAELTALAQYAFGLSNDDDSSRLVTVLITNSVEVGITLDGTAYHQGGDISSLADTRNVRLDQLLGWAAVRARVDELCAAYPETNLPQDGLTYMHIHYGAVNGDRAALALCDELSTYLARIMAWIVGLLRPDHVSLAGPIVNLGEDFLAQIVTKVDSLLGRSVSPAITFSLAYSGNLSAIGAAALALHSELDIL